LLCCQACKSARPLRPCSPFFSLVALTLAGCGRKSGLDLPPSAAAAPAPSEEKEADAKTISPISKPPKPKPRVVPQRDLPIDILLN
jgi:predicted small lipoprotein YifL